MASQEKTAKYMMQPNLKDGFPFSKKILAVAMGKTEIKMNQAVYLGREILDLNKALMYDYMQPTYGSKIKLCYMDTDSFLCETKTEDFYRDIEKDVETKFDRNGYSKDDNRPLPVGSNEKVIDIMKDELFRKIMTEFVALRAKMYAYKKINKKVKDKHCKVTKNCVVAESLTFGILRPVCLTARQYTGRKCCLKARTLRCTHSISIGQP